MASITAPGAGSGLDIGGLVAQLVAAEAEPATLRLARREADTQAEISALGSLKGAVSALRSSLAALDSSADLDRRLATSSDPKRFTAAADASAVPGSYDVEVVRLAGRHKLRSVGFADATSSVGTGTLTISANGETFSVDVASGGDGLGAIRDAINAAPGNSSVSATLVTVDDGAGGSEVRLVLSAAGTGSAGAITVIVADDDGTDGDAAGLSRLAYDTAPGGATQLVELAPATDALVRIDGQDVTRSTNTVADAVDGVTLELLEAAPGETLGLDVALDKGTISGAVSGFVQAYNALNDTIGSLSVFDAASGQRGILLGDATLRAIEGTARRIVGGEVEGLGGTFRTLASIGVTTRDDGALALDTVALEQALDEDFDGVVALLGGETGIGRTLDGALEPFVRSAGTIDSRTDGLDGRLDRIDEQREALQRRLDALERRLLDQFIAMDQLVGELQSTGTFLTQQLTALQGALGGGDR